MDSSTRAHLFEHIQDEFLVPLSDAHGHGLPVHALAEVSHAHQVDELPGTQPPVVPLQAQLEFVLCEAVLIPAAPHGLQELPQQVLNLER